MPWIKSTNLPAKRLRSWALLAVLALILLAVAMAPYGWRPSHIWRMTTCLAAKHASLWPQYRFEGFFKTTTVEQTIDIDSMENCEIRVDDNQTTYFTPHDPKKIATLRLTIRKDFDDYVFFPRVSKDSEVLVCEGNLQNVLFRLQGEDSWTPIGRRYLLNLACCEHNEKMLQFPVTLFIVLRGPWAQLWLPSGAIFFR